MNTHPEPRSWWGWWADMEGVRRSFHRRVQTLPSFGRTCHVRWMFNAVWKESRSGHRCRWRTRGVSGCLAGRDSFRERVGMLSHACHRRCTLAVHRSHFCGCWTRRRTPWCRGRNLLRDSRRSLAIAMLPTPSSPASECRNAMMCKCCCV